MVKLALAIAARVLHREAKLDPLLLAGVVRVALEKVAEDSATVLRVPLDAVAMWREIFVGSTGVRCRWWEMSAWAGRVCARHECWTGGAGCERAVGGD